MSELIIEAGRTESQYWRDLWGYRELFYVLAWRDITVRYKQTKIGILWALIQPFLNSVVMTFIFEYVAKVKPVGTVPYLLMVFVATMPWQFFSTSLSGATQSVLSNAGLISKIYFPRLIIPAGAVVTALADLGVAFVLLLGIMAYYWYWPTWRMLFLPLFVLLGFGAALGPGLFLTALTVKYRDFRIIVPFVMQLGYFLTPVAYPTSRVPEKWLGLYSLNPMVAVIDGFRWSILGGEFALRTSSFMLSLAMTIFFMLLGVWYFRKTEKSFADVI